MSWEVFITCAVNGGGDSHKKHPSIPITPKQIAESAVAAAKAGAAIVHCHVRDPVTGDQSYDPKLFVEVTKRIRDSGVDVAVNLTGGNGGRWFVSPADPKVPEAGSYMLPALERISYIEEARPEICTIDCGSMNFGNDNLVYVAPLSYLRQKATWMKQLGVKPEFEAFDTGQLWQIETLINEGLGGEPPLVQLCMGIAYGAPQDLGTLKAMVDRMPKGAIWSSFGIGRDQMRMVAQSALLGGNIRVGLEDNIYLSRGEFATNEQLVSRAKSILEQMGATVLGPKQVREKLKLRTPT